MVTIAIVGDNTGLDKRIPDLLQGKGIKNTICKKIEYGPTAAAEIGALKPEPDIVILTHKTANQVDINLAIALTAHNAEWKKKLLVRSTTVLNTPELKQDFMMIGLDDTQIVSSSGNDFIERLTSLARLAETLEQRKL